MGTLVKFFTFLSTVEIFLLTKKETCGRDTHCESPAIDTPLDNDKDRRINERMCIPPCGNFSFYGKSVQLYMNYPF